MIPRTRVVILLVLAVLTGRDFINLVRGYIYQKSTTGVELKFNKTLTSPRLTICLPLVPNAILRDGRWPSKEEIVDILNNHPMKHASALQVRKWTHLVVEVEVLRNILNIPYLQHSVYLSNITYTRSCGRRRRLKASGCPWCICILETPLRTVVREAGLSEGLPPPHYLARGAKYGINFRNLPIYNRVNYFCEKFLLRRYF